MWVPPLARPPSYANALLYAPALFTISTAELNAINQNLAAATPPGGKPIPVAKMTATLFYVKNRSLCSW